MSHPDRREAKRKATAPPLDHHSKRRNVIHTTMLQSPLQSPTGTSLLEIPAELRLHIYRDVASGDDPAIELQSLSLTCKLIGNEISGDMAKCTTIYLRGIEDELNEDISIPIRISKPKHRGQVGSVVLSLPLSPFISTNDPRQSRAPIYTEYMPALEHLENLRRERLTIDLYEDRVGVSHDTQSYVDRMEIGRLGVAISQHHHQCKLKALETTYDWTNAPCSPIARKELQVTMRIIRRRVYPSWRIGHDESSLSWRAMSWGKIQVS
ncbi:Nn.00g083730.m01.CDS01 [Neocucurbitaria sp. VM-36]